MGRANGEGTIYQRSDGKWCGQVTVGFNPKTGKQKRKSFYGDTKKEVTRKMTEFKHKMNIGEYIEPSNMKLSEWLERWLEGRKSTLAYNTFKSYKSKIKKHLNPVLGDISLKDLKARHIQEMLNHKLEHGKLNGKGGLAPVSVNLLYRILHAALEQAVKENLLPSNPCKAVETPKERNREMETWNSQQVNKFLEAAEESKHHALFYIALNTGMRRGELIGLTWEDIDLDKQKIEVKRQMVRTDNGLEFKEVKSEASKRTIPLTDNVVKFLKSHKIKQGEKKLSAGAAYNDRDLVFCNKAGHAIDSTNLNREFKRVIERAKVPDIRFHDLRHTFATLFIENGGAIKTLQQILGHTSVTITMDTYSHVTEEMLSEAAQNIDEMYRVRSKK